MLTTYISRDGKAYEKGRAYETTDKDFHKDVIKSGVAKNIKD